MRKIVALVVAVLLAPSGARAQARAGSFEELLRMLKAGQTVVVTDGSGRTTKGKVTDMSSASFAVVSGTRNTTFGSGALSARVRRDGLKNGILAGAGVGLLPAVMLGLSGCSDYDCSDYGVALISSAFFVPAGIGIGTLIDWAFRHDEVHIAYVRSPGSSASITMSPLLGEKTGGVSFAVRF